MVEMRFWLMVEHGLRMLVEDVKCVKESFAERQNAVRVGNELMTCKMYLGAVSD